MSSSSSSTGGASGATLLGIAFVILKLTGVIDWSWWWVLAPFWVPMSVLVVLLALCFPFWMMSRSTTKKRRRR